MATGLGAAKYIDCSTLTQRGVADVFNEAVLAALEPPSTPSMSSKPKKAARRTTTFQADALKRYSVVQNKRTTSKLALAERTSLWDALGRFIKLNDHANVQLWVEENKHDMEQTMPPLHFANEVSFGSHSPCCTAPCFYHPTL